MTKKVLVTGGAGFIGSHLVNYLVQENYEVTVVDDLSMGNLKNIDSIHNVHIYTESITNYSFMRKLLIENNFDYIYLLAAVASVADSVSRPYETHQVNQEANLFILETIRTHKLNVKKVIFASSAAVYGDELTLPKTEESTILPLTPYAIDKFASERYVIDYYHLYSIPTVAVRFFNVYGPKQNPTSPYSGVLSILAESFKNELPFKIYGDGHQTRDFVFISDVINALILMMNPHIVGEVYNIASGKSISLNDIILIFEEITNKKISLQYVSERKGDIKYSEASINKLQSIGYTSNYSIFEGIRKYWEYIINH